MSVLKVTRENFEQEVIKSEKKVLLDFWASWCGPCMMVSPLVDEIAEETNEYLIGKVNVDEEPQLAQAFGIVSIPTLVVMQDGKVIKQALGARPKADILKLLED
ncbi:MAG: thioredoxin [Clostridia bacterium]|nr:thioredoxin [Clostridia bacterium]